MKHEPGIYTGVPMAEYLAAPAASASLLQTLLEECPHAAWFRSWLNPKAAPARESTAAQDAGTIAHSIILEGSRECVQEIDPRDFPTKSTGNIPDGWTNKDIRAARDAAIDAGKIPVLTPQMRVVEGMVEAAWRYIESLKNTEPAIHALMQPGGGDSEVTMLWRDGETLCRIRPDRLGADRGICLDYKTTARSCEPATWGRTNMVGLGYYADAALYRRGIRALCGAVPTQVYFVQEQKPPHLCSLVGLDPVAIDLGDRKTTRALEVWEESTRTGNWPAYPTRVCYPEIPPWEIARWESGHGYGERAPANDDEPLDELGKPLPRGTREAWAAFGG